MVGPSHRLKCKMPNRTNHKFPGNRGPGVQSESTVLREGGEKLREGGKEDGREGGREGGGGREEGMEGRGRDGGRGREGLGVRAP